MGALTLSVLLRYMEERLASATFGQLLDDKGVKSSMKWEEALKLIQALGKKINERWRDLSALEGWRGASSPVSAWIVERRQASNGK